MIHLWLQWTKTEKVTAVAVGTATITAKTVDGGYTALCAVTVPAPYDLWVGGTQVTGANAADVLGNGGSVKYDPATNTLTLTDATISSTSSYGIKADGFDLTIDGVDTDADGSNQIIGSVNAIKNSMILPSPTR